MSVWLKLENIIISRQLFMTWPRPQSVFKFICNLLRSAGVNVHCPIGFIEFLRLNDASNPLDYTILIGFQIKMKNGKLSARQTPTLLAKSVRFVRLKNEN